MTLPTMLPGLCRGDLLDWCRRIDVGPFSSVAVGERLGYPNPDAAVTLAAAAAWTERVRVVATVLVGPMHSTAWLAKRAASLDLLSAGRFTLGLGVGGREEDYRLAGASFARRHARLDEQVAELRRIWAGEPALDGTAPVGPPPLQPGGPPLWIGALGAKPLARAARWADGLAGFSLGPDRAEVDAGFRAAERAWRDAGRETRPWLATSFWFALGPDAERQLADYASRYLAVFGPQAARALGARCVAAGPDAVRGAIAAVRECGADELILVPTSAAPSQLERLLDLVG